MALKIKASLVNKPRANKGHTGIDFYSLLSTRMDNTLVKLEKNKTKLLFLENIPNFYCELGANLFLEQMSDTRQIK